MADHKGSLSDGVVSDDQLRRTVSNKQRVKDKLANKNLQPSNPTFICSLCLFLISSSSHIVECEACSQWSHSKCVDIIPSLAPTYPYVCSFCIKSVFSQIKEIRTEISDLWRQISSLESSINCDVSPHVQSEILRINDCLFEISVKVSSNISKPTQPLTLQVTLIPTNPSSANKLIKPADIDRNLNIVI